MLATLPMYDLPALRSDTDAWWAGLADALEAEGLVGVPATLTRGPDLLAQWCEPTLLLAQTCGYPLTSYLQSKVRLVALPCYSAPGCYGGLYSSALIMRRDEHARSLADMRGRRVVLNSHSSHSGMNVLRVMVAEIAKGQSFFSSVAVSGGHAQSVDMVLRGDADLTAVDCVTLALLRDIDPDRMQGTRVLELSPHAPGLPYITSCNTSDDELARMQWALRRAFDDPALAGIRDRLHLRDFEVPSQDDYAVITAMRQRAQRLGYSVVQ